MAPSQLGAFTRSSPEQATPNLQYPFPAAVPRPLRRAAPPFRRLHRQRLQSAPHQPRLHPSAQPRCRRPAQHPAQLPDHARGQADRGGSHPPHPPDRPGPRAGGLCAGGMEARGRAGRARRSWSRPPGRSAPRSSIPWARRGWGPPTIRRPWSMPRLQLRGMERPARGRCLGHAADHLGQHQLAHHHDRREGGGDDSGGCTPLEFRPNDQE